MNEFHQITAQERDGGTLRNKDMDISDYLDDKMRNNNMIMKKYANSTTNY